MERIDVPCAAGRTTSATVLPTAGDARRPCRAHTNLTHRGRHSELHACTSFDAGRHALWYGEAGSGIRRGSIEGTVVVPRGRVAMPLESDRRRCDAVIPLVDSSDEQVCAGAPGPWQASIGWSCRCRIERNPCVVRRTWVANQMQGERLQARWHGASRMTEKKKTSQNRPQPGPGRSDASTERKWHSSPGRTGLVFRRLPARLVAVRTSRPVTAPEAGREPHPPSTRSFKSCPELSLRPGLAGALFFSCASSAHHAG
jgi:hypothetical protein